MHIQFDSMKVTDFRSYTGSHVFHFGDIGLHLLKGKNKHKPSLGANDAGKSTLWDAFCWGLTGLMVKKLRNTKAIPWSKPKATPTVRIAFHIDKKAHTLVRSAYPSSLLLDGREVDQGAVDALVQLPHEILTQSLLMGQGRPLFFDLAPRDKMALFSEILPLQRWDDRSEKASERLKLLERKKADLETGISRDKVDIERIGSDLIEARAKSTSWERDNEKAQAALRKEIKSVTADLARVTKIRDTADLDYENQNLKIKDSDKINDQIEEAIGLLNKKRDDAVRKRADTNSTIRFLKNILGDIEDTGICPTCNQSIKGSDLAEHRKKHKTYLDDNRLQLKKHVAEFDKLEKELDDWCTKRIELREIRKKIQAKANELESLLRTSTTDFANYSAKLVNLKSKLKDLADGENPYRDQIVRLRKRKAEATAALEEGEANLDRIEKKLAPTKFWIKGFKDVRLQIIDEVLGELEMATNTMLPQFGLDEWEVQFDIERETQKGTIRSELNVSIFSPDHKEAVSWEEWGGGVGQRLRLISTLALSEVLLNHAGVTTNLEILDEPTRSLNVEGVVDLCEFLADRAKSLGKSIWLIDHRSIESSDFSSVHTIVKDESGSHIA